MQKSFVCQVLLVKDFFQKRKMFNQNPESRIQYRVSSDNPVIRLKKCRNILLWPWIIKNNKFSWRKR